MPAKPSNRTPTPADCWRNLTGRSKTRSRQQQSGLGVTDAQQQQLEVLQSRIVSHLKIKALNLAQVEFIDLLRKITQTIQKPLNLQEGAAVTGGGGTGGPRLTGMR